MDEDVASLAGIEAALSAVTRALTDGDPLQAAGDDHVLDVLGAAARVANLAQAIVAVAGGHVEERAHRVDPDERITYRRGCRTVGELVCHVTGMSGRSAAELRKVARGVMSVQPPGGGPLPPDFPRLRAALGEGHIGLDKLTAIVSPLTGLPGDVLGAADEELTAAACGRGADGAPPADADTLRQYATVWAAYFDPDGGAPAEDRAMRKRGVRLGGVRDGLVPLGGHLLPEVAAQFQLLCDSIGNPRVSDPGVRFVPEDAAAHERLEDSADTRTHAQRQHDVLATILIKAAGSGQVPTLAGQAPTLTVSVRAEDLASGRGHAFIDGIDGGVPLAVAHHVACSGIVQRVTLDGFGRILATATQDRVFNHHQRRAIALRDGTCVIPGCRVPATWCEVHHVIEHARGGPTDTDNGVLVCWFHHRTLDRSGWQIRMRDGVPEVRGPSWWDYQQLWRPATSSPTRQRDRMRRPRGPSSPPRESRGRAPARAT